MLKQQRERIIGKQVPVPKTIEEPVVTERLRHSQAVNMELQKPLLPNPKELLDISQVRRRHSDKCVRSNIHCQRQGARSKFGKPCTVAVGVEKCEAYNDIVAVC